MQYRVEALLAKLYSDSDIMNNFLNCPEEFLKKESIPDDIAKEIMSGDLVGMKLAAESYSKKRKKRKHTNLWHRIKSLLDGKKASEHG